MISHCTELGRGLPIYNPMVSRQRSMQLYTLAVVLWIYGIKNALTERACPPPNQSCDCQDSAQGYIYCRGMNSLPKHLPSNVTQLDLNFNNVGSELLRKQVILFGNFSAIKIETTCKSYYAYNPPAILRNEKFLWRRRMLHTLVLL